MNEASLRDGLRRHYGERRLPDDRRRALAARLTAAPRRRVPWTGLAVAAAIVAAFVIGAVLFGGDADDDPAQLAGRVAAEIAMNHAKHPDVEIETGSYEHVRSQLQKLDFAVVAPGASVVRGLSLNGARYCSLQGHIAAQLRLADVDGARVTLYQVRDTDTFDAIDETTVEVNGLRVHLWRENGVLLGLARPAR